jgi:hypothetical protein
MVPADPESNNIRIFVINRNVDQVRMLRAASVLLVSGDGN